MPSAQRTSAARRRLVRALVLAATVGASTVLPAAAASADDPAGTVVRGQLVQGWAEAGPDEVAAGQAADGQVAWIQPASGDALPVDPDDVAGITPGSTVSAVLGDGDDEDGEEDTEDVADLEDVAVVAPPAAPALADPAGLTNQVTVVLVRPGGVAADAVTESQVVDAVNGRVADFWSEQTDGAVRVGVTESHDWLATTAGCSDATKLWNEVAATVGFAPEPGKVKHLLLYISGAATGCSYALAEVGASPATGGRLYVTAVQPSSIAHELGHNFGLGHSSGQQCDSSVEGGTCRTVGYRDYYDVMGASWAQMGSLNAPQAAALQLLPGTAQASLSVRDAVTTVTLAPISGRSGTRAVRLVDAANTSYWLEYRPAAARDAWLATGANGYRLQAGVLLRRAGAMPDTSVLLDGTPSAAAAWAPDFQPALPVGTAVPVSEGDFSVVVQSVSAAGAVLSITPVAPAGAPAPAPARTASGGGTEVLPDAPAPAAAPAVPAYFGPTGVGRAELSPRPRIEEAASSTTLTGVLLAAAGTLLTAGSLVTVRRLRRRAWVGRA